MTVEQFDKVDFIGLDNENKKIVLFITDHLEWEDDGHFMILQEKLNKYLDFIESGDIWEKYEDKKDYSCGIELVAKYDFTDEAIEFLEKVKEIVEGLGFEFHYKVADLSDD